MSNLRREPEEESVGLYPGLVVHDGRQGGSITVGPSRLPVSTLIHSAILEGWEEVEAGWSPSRYDWTAEAMADFLHTCSASAVSSDGSYSPSPPPSGHRRSGWTRRSRGAARSWSSRPATRTPSSCLRRGGKTKCSRRRFSNSFAGVWQSSRARKSVRPQATVTDSTVSPGTPLKIPSFETSGRPRRSAVAATHRSASWCRWLSP